MKIILNFFICVVILLFIVLLILSVSEHKKTTEAAFKKCAENNNKIMQVIDACVDRGRSGCLRYKKREINLCDYPKSYKGLIINKL